jgi:hypothetical protein
MTVTSVAVPPPLEDLTVPSIKDIDLTELTNPNQPTTALSTLCWARQQIVLAMLWVIQQEIDGRGTDTSYRQHMMEAVEEVRDDIDQLPVAVLQSPIEKFAAAFQRDLAAASVLNVLPDETLRLFHFEDYPGVRAYVAAARTEPACVEP